MEPYLPANVQLYMDKPFAKTIQTLQASGDCVVGSRLAVDGEMRTITDVDYPLVKLGRDAALYIQYIVEQEMLAILRGACRAASHAKHGKVAVADIELALALRA